MPLVPYDEVLENFKKLLRTNKLKFTKTARAYFGDNL